MLTDLLGMSVATKFENPHAGYNGVTLDIPGKGTQWELLEPRGENSFLVKFLEERGPGLHHVTFQVQDIDEAVKGVEAYGYEPFGYRAHGPYKEVFLHPKDTGGVLIQLYEGDWE
jgi:methylmalonyl-CoA/ethylmalonyl-CoA epimerase